MPEVMQKVVRVPKLLAEKGRLPSQCYDAQTQENDDFGVQWSLVDGE